MEGKLDFLNLDEELEVAIPEDGKVDLRPPVQEVVRMDLQHGAVQHKLDGTLHCSGGDAGLSQRFEPHPFCSRTGIPEAARSGRVQVGPVHGR